MKEEETKESISDIVTRLKLALVNAKDARTDQGYEVLVLIAIRIVEKLEKELGISPIIVKSFKDKKSKGRKMGVAKIKPDLIFTGEVLKCGRIKQKCDHTRASRPHSCGKKNEGVCYGVSYDSIAL